VHAHAGRAVSEVLELALGFRDVNGKWSAPDQGAIGSRKLIDLRSAPPVLNTMYFLVLKSKGGKSMFFPVLAGSTFREHVSYRIANVKLRPVTCLSFVRGPSSLFIAAEKSGLAAELLAETTLHGEFFQCLCEIQHCAF
jgi:hypothetical protein